MTTQTTKGFEEMSISGSDKKGWRWSVKLPDGPGYPCGNAATFDEAQKRIREAIDAGF